MATKLKKKIKSYFNHIWMIEILVVALTCIFFGVEIYKDVFTRYYSKNLAAMQATINPKGFYKQTFLDEVKGLQKYIYNNTFGLEELYYNDKNREEILKAYFINNSYEGSDIDSSDSKLYFIIRDKRDNSIITNDFSDALSVSDGLTEQDIQDYLYSKYKGREMLKISDNENTSEENLVYNSGVLSNFQEYYYSDINRYTNINNLKIAILNFIIIFIAIFMLMKIIFVFVRSRGKVELRGNFVKSVIFVLKYGITYKETRRTLMITFCSLSLFFIVYLYLLAVNGGYENNILAKFFSMYPFKGSFLIMLLPMIGIIYSLKKSIEIIKVNEAIKKSDDGNINYEIEEQCSPEVRELLNNISKIKEGYSIAVEDALRNEKLKTELISNVSHDLRTPLTSIINYVNILRQDITKDEKEDYLAIVEKKAKKLKVLIDDLFEMSKINSGKMELFKDNIDIVSLIHQTIGEYYYIYESKNIEFKVDSYKEEVYIDLDGKLISRAIENIIINAMKYSLEGTRVYVDIREKDGYIVLSFKNISNYEMDFDNKEIFERFARGDASRNSRIEGSGLGLAITKSIIELHDGKVYITREGDMFKIFIYLPFNKENEVDLG
ncbi:MULTISPECIES: sensor histidine kinase [Clostridium]|uniref:sensor histidine kinase n=2 Tax=Bacillota TaxID=1239 RepID=UPI001FA8D915|nr:MULTISPECIES: HAMP domain-containing sensor histidine kinase [Clostridium]MDU3324117.1 HAMP domain-containing sensor histidine kinase [Escherichia coli]MDB2075798.1 HAMP domain-containing sensor histidine kinase [Clostridium paraputrificum]MDB2078838.1 HAMP domain-containing sensor histidine kinase [Clostridium paraputrificum]MDB2085654.1 HAMP domain-containing sensor histidine kinase [Clostridium paraputrificum]MDB2092475.1 HAMP domain-containing sensor histidine kinase [Clostridium parapu